MGSAESMSSPVESPGEGELTTRQCSSLVSLPTFVRNEEKVPLEVLEMLTTHKHLYAVLLHNYPSLLISSRSFSDSGRLHEQQVCCHRILDNNRCRQCSVVNLPTFIHDVEMMLLEVQEMLTTHKPLYANDTMLSMIHIISSILTRNARNFCLPVHKLTSSVKKPSYREQKFGTHYQTNCRQPTKLISGDV
ncbi:hypothetical protein J6590_044013 [Homalodisca vitripennis]|nr:hypothetical protein J6590_044013 [Homalodisca vitripennis]